MVPRSDPFFFIGVTCFGAFCQACRHKLGDGRGTIKGHLTKAHGFREDSLSWAEFDRQYKLRLQFAKTQIPIAAFLTNQMRKGYKCGCGFGYPDEKSANRHANGKRSPCTVASVEESPLVYSTCFRLVPITRPSNQIAPEAGLPFKSTLEILKHYVRDDENVETYIPLFHPVSCRQTMAEFKQYFLGLYQGMSRPPEANEFPLKAALSACENWLTESARYAVGMVPGNYRASLLVFGGQEVSERTVSSTFTFRHHEATLVRESKKILSFLFRHPLFSRDFPIPETHLINEFCVVRILTTCLVQAPGSLFRSPLLVEYCLTRSFRLVGGGEDIILGSAGDNASAVSAAVALARTAVCTFLYCQQAIDSVAPKLLKQIQAGRCLNILCPMIRRLRDVQRAKATVSMRTISPEGDIAINGFEFLHCDWSCLIPTLSSTCDEILASIVEGSSWKNVTDLRLQPKVSIVSNSLFNFKIDMEDNQTLNSSDIVLREDYPVSKMEQFAAYMRLAFSGSGCGSMRDEETSSIQVTHCSWHRGTLYYKTTSNKTPSAMVTGNGKQADHKLARQTSRRFLLFRCLLQQKGEYRTLLPSEKDVTFTMPDAMAKIFSLEEPPTRLEVRHVWTTLTNYIFPNGDFGTSISADAAVATQAKHSSVTHQASYSTEVRGGKEMMYRKFHQALGDSDGVGADEEARILPVDLKRALCLFFGPNASYKSELQQTLVEDSVSSSHTHASLVCGGGKSMTWLAPVAAGRLKGLRRTMTVVVLPYVFLMEYQVHIARTMMDASLDVTVVGLTGGRSRTTNCQRPWQIRTFCPICFFLQWRLPREFYVTISPSS